MEPGISLINDQVKEASGFISPLRNEMHKVIVGQEDLLNRLILGLLANGHLLLEGVPGLAKTLAVQTLASAIHTEFQRIQFTPDLLPADLIGTLVYNPKNAEFFTKKGPVFANIILADEINRAPAKVQSALLEAMQERQVTIGDETFVLPDPFLVLATENPVEQEGTYPLPEAQVDRFMMKLNIAYPTLEEERQILDRMARTEADTGVESVVTPDQIFAARKVIDQIYLDDKIKDYILSITFSTRTPDNYGLRIKDYILYGASPRATIAMTLCSKAQAFMSGRGYVTPQDVKQVAPDILRHRILLTYEAEAEEVTSEQIIQQVLDQLPVP